MSQHSHDARIEEQFGRQAAGFAASPELHAKAQLALIVDAAEPKLADVSLDVACGPGSLVAAFAPHVKRARGLDATPAMIEQARALQSEKRLGNVDWHLGSVYALPFGDDEFDIVTCRFAFHHLERPAAAFAEMMRVCGPGGRIVVSDGVAPDDPRKAAAFNAMERHRDPSTVEFRTLGFLQRVFAGAGFHVTKAISYQVAHEVEVLIARSFPANDDRETLRRMIRDLIDTDALGVGTKPGGTKFIYAAVALVAVKPR